MPSEDPGRDFVDGFLPVRVIHGFSLGPAGGSVHQLAYDPGGARSVNTTAAAATGDAAACLPLAGRGRDVLQDLPVEEADLTGFFEEHGHN